MFLAHLPAQRRNASLASLSTSEIEKWRDAELLAGKGGTTADYGIKVLRAALNSARRKGIILSNPAEAVDLVDNDAETRDPFPDDELKALLMHADQDWKGAILVGVWCGPRLADVANLEWENINLEDGTLTVLAEKTARKKPKPLVIAMHPQLLAHLKSLPRGIGKAPLFPTLYGRKAGSHGGLSNEFSRLMDRAGVVVSLGRKKEGAGRQFRNKGFHSLRHTMISRMADAEISSDVRRAMAGHSSDAAHRRYVHLNLATQRKALKRMNAIAS
jgi:integrase